MIFYEIHTFNTTNVIGDVLLQTSSIGLLLVEVQQMLLKNLICCLVGFPQVLQKLQK